MVDSWSSAGVSRVKKDRPLTSAERAQVKAEWEGFYKRIDDDLRANFDKVIPDFLMTSDLYAKDQSFIDAYKNGTLKVQHGEDVADIPVIPWKIFSDANGNFAGSAAPQTSMGNLAALVQIQDGRTVTKSDGKNAAIGEVNGQTFLVTW
jgi:hypothetical protein